MSVTGKDSDGIRVGGFLITKMISTPGKKEDEAGKLIITLESVKDEINCGAFELGDIIKAINVHQEGKHPVVVRLHLTTDAIPNQK